MLIETYKFGLGFDGNIDAELNRIDKKIKGLGTNSGKGAKGGGVGKSFKGGLAGGLGGTKLLAGLGVGSVIVAFKSFAKAAAEIQTAITGVGKTTGLAGKELSGLKDSLLEMGTKTGVPVARLFEIAQAAGQLGVSASDDILKFTDVIQKLDLATDDLNGADAASKLKTILDATGEGVENIERLASAFVSLGNKTNATEGQIANIATGLAVATSQFNTSSESVVALSNVFATLKQQPELVRSTIGKTLAEIQLAFVEGGEKAEQFAEIAGMSVGAFESLFKHNALDALTAFSEGLGRQAEEGKSVVQNLQELKLAGVGYQTILGSLASANEKLATAQKLTSKEYENANALNEEAATASKTYDQAVGRLSNSFVAFKEKLGVLVLPALTAFVDALTFSLNAITSFVKGVKDSFKSAEERQIATTKNLAYAKSGFDAFHNSFQNAGQNVGRTSNSTTVGDVNVTINESNNPGQTAAAVVSGIQNEASALIPGSD